MTGKAEDTRIYILKKVAPIFNRKGYFGTSLVDMTEATGLTKGALYGNFKNKEELAIEAFSYNIKYIIKTLSELLKTEENAASKLLLIVDFYRDYLSFSDGYGGCPIVNSGTNSIFKSEKMGKRVDAAVKDFHHRLTLIIKTGQEKEHIKSTIDAELLGGRIYAMINGAVFMAGVRRERIYLDDMMDQLTIMIEGIRN